MSVASQTDILRARERSGGSDHGPNGAQLRNRQSALSSQPLNFMDRAAVSCGSGKNRSGSKVQFSLEGSNDSREHLHMAIPVGVGSFAGSRNAARRNVLYVVFDRVLDLVPYPKNALNTILPTSVILLVVELILAFLFSLDWAGIFVNAAVTLSVASVPLVLYLLKDRSEKRIKEKAMHELTGEGVLKLAQNERDRIDSAAQHLRSEERAFIQRQLNRTNALETLSRKRSHLFANVFTAMELANTQLIELLEANKISVPPTLRPTHLRETLWKQLDILIEQEGGIAEMMVKDDPPTGTGH